MHWGRAARWGWRSCGDCPHSPPSLSCRLWPAPEGQLMAVVSSICVPGTRASRTGPVLCGVWPLPQRKRHVDSIPSCVMLAPSQLQQRGHRQLQIRPAWTSLRTVSAGRGGPWTPGSQGSGAPACAEPRPPPRPSQALPHTGPKDLSRYPTSAPRPLTHRHTPAHSLIHAFVYSPSSPGSRPRRQ